MKAMSATIRAEVEKYLETLMVSWEVMVVSSVAVIAAKVMHPFGWLITSS